MPCLLPPQSVEAGLARTLRVAGQGVGGIRQHGCFVFHGVQHADGLLNLAGSRGGRSQPWLAVAKLADRLAVLGGAANVAKCPMHS